MLTRLYWSEAQWTEEFLSSTLATMSSMALQSSLLRMLPVLSDTLSTPPAKKDISGSSSSVGDMSCGVGRTAVKGAVERVCTDKAQTQLWASDLTDGQDGL